MIELSTSKRTYLGLSPEGKKRWALDCSIDAIQFRENSGEWQDIDPSIEAPDNDDFAVKFTQVPYLGRIGNDSRRRIYPDRTDPSYWIQFDKPFASMPEPRRENGWFYWNFTNALIGVIFGNTSIKFGFRLKNASAPNSITIPFSSQGITRTGRHLYHNGDVVAVLRKPLAIDANGKVRDCMVSFGNGEVTISLDTTGLVFPIEIDPTLDLTVGASSDDAIEYNTGVVNIDLTSYIFYSLNEWAGFRCTGVNIPAGATIGINSYMTIYVVAEDDPSVYIHCQDANNPPTFAAINYNISGRARTTQKAWWRADNIGTGWKNTPSLTSPIQENVDNNGGTGDALVFIFDNIGGPLQAIGWVTWDYGTHQYAPKIHIEYTTGGAGADLPSALMGAKLIAGKLM